MKIEDLRNEINTIDDEMVKLFDKRMHKVREIAGEKKQSGKTVLDRQRENEIIERVTRQVSPDLETYTKILFQTMFSLSRSYQASEIMCDSELSKQIKTALEITEKQFPSSASVACQGVPGAYSQIACGKLFTMPRIMYFNSFDNVFKAVEKGLCRYGILPIENSSYGSVTAVYDLMKQHKFFIVKSIRLKVDHYLLANSGTNLSNIKEIFSHEQAIGQCAEFLGKLDGVKVTVCENTAVAAKMVAESGRDDVATISSYECAELYGLSVLDGNIQDTDSNYTRFICISKETEIYPGADKISLMLSIPHRPGSLFELMSKFAALGLNLTKLESRPIVGKDFEFMFYFDLEASVYSDSVLALLNELSAGTGQFTFLGSYSEH